MTGTAENLVKCHHSYQAEQEDELSLNINDIIQVEEYHDDSWWFGKNLSTELKGVFPSNFVMPLSTHSVSIPRDAERVQAAFDYEPQAPDELYLKKGDLITVISKEDGWWSGEVDGKIGLFPANFVIPYNSPADEKDPSFSKYNTAPTQAMDTEESTEPPKRTSFTDNFKLAAYGVKKGGLGSLFSGTKSLKGKSKNSARNSQTSDAEIISPIPSPRQSIASIPEEITVPSVKNNSSNPSPARLPGGIQPSNPSPETHKDNPTSPQSRLPPIPNTSSLPSPPQANLPQPPNKPDVKSESVLPHIPLPVVPDLVEPLRSSSSSLKNEADNLNASLQNIDTSELTESVDMDQKPDSEKHRLEESDNDTPTGPGFKLAAYGVKKGGIGGLMATGGMPQLRKVNTGNPIPVSNSRISSSPSIPRTSSSPEIPTVDKPSENNEKEIVSDAQEVTSGGVPETKQSFQNSEVISSSNSSSTNSSIQNSSVVTEVLPINEKDGIASAKSLDYKDNMTESKINESATKEEFDDLSDIIAAVTQIADSYSSAPNTEFRGNSIPPTDKINEGQKEEEIDKDTRDSDSIDQNPKIVDKEVVSNDLEDADTLKLDSLESLEILECQDGTINDKIDINESKLPNAQSECKSTLVTETLQIDSIVEQVAENNSETIQPTPLQARLALKADSSPLVSDNIISGPRGKRPATRKPRGTASDEPKSQLTQSEALESAVKQDYEASNTSQETPEKTEEISKSDHIGKSNKVATPFAGLTGPPKLPTKPVLARFQNLNSQSAESISTQNTNTNQEDQRPRGRFTGARSSFAEQLERSSVSNTSPTPVNSMQERLKSFVREEVDKIQKEFESQLEVERQARLALEQEIIALKARLDEINSNKP